MAFIATLSVISKPICWGCKSYSKIRCVQSDVFLTVFEASVAKLADAQRQWPTIAFSNTAQGVQRA